MSVIQLNTGREHYQIEDKVGVIAEYDLLPNDIRMFERISTMDSFVKKIDLKMKRIKETPENIAKINKEIEDKIDWVFGYEASDGLFQKVPALTPLPDGNIFFKFILEQVQEALIPAAEELKKQAEEAEAEADKYLAEVE